MNNGDLPANPLPNLVGGYVPSEIDGLTKREHFAAMAMQGLMSNQYFNHADVEGNCDLAIDYADALLKALEDNG